MNTSEKSGHDPNRHGICRDDRGQDQPNDKSRARHATHSETAGRKPNRMPRPKNDRKARGE